MTRPTVSEMAIMHVTNDQGNTSHVETWGPNWNVGDDVMMEPHWSCGFPCKINKYDEDGNIVEYRRMNILQMRDHLIYYHAEIGHTLWQMFMELLRDRVRQIEGQFNQVRQARVEAEANELAKIKKEFGYA